MSCNPYQGVKRAVRPILERNAPSLLRVFGSFHLAQDRKMLESIILASLADDPSVRRLLFIGCDWYTKPYERLFGDHEYWTLDIDPDKRRYGSRRHVTDCLRNLERYVPSNYFDAIVCNGVFMMTAIETPEEAEPSFMACYHSLRPGGWFILGWNDTDELRPYPPSDSAALSRFSPVVFPPLRTKEVLTATSYRHTFTFFCKPEGHDPPPHEELAEHQETLSVTPHPP